MTEKPLINLKIPVQGRSEDASRQPLNINLSKGSKLFVVGPNGSGKSALMSRSSSIPDNNIKIIRAYRKNWMASSSVNISPWARLESERAFHIHEKMPDSRYKSYSPDVIINNALFDLVESENTFARDARKAINEPKSNRENKLRNLEEKFKEINSPLGKLNNVLEHGSFNIRISIGQNQQIQASKNEKTFEASQLSDGERNALILSCHILCSPEGIVFFVDEPEQHLHHAIASPLLSALINERSDCAFVIFTHEISLVEAIPGANVLVLRHCRWDGDQPSAWDCSLLKSDEDIPSETRRAILGGRKRILFVEGTTNSLDRQLYKVIYPDFTVQPVGGCSEVIRAVNGLKKSSNFHWIDAYGIIDQDGRDESNTESLKGDNIFALPEFSIESLFYGKTTRAIVARNKAQELGIDAEELSSESESSALQHLQKHGGRLAAQRCEFKIRQQVISKIPKVENIIQNVNETINISVPSPYREEKEQFDKLLEQDDLDSLIAHYPIRESGALPILAKGLHYQSCNDYEAAVIQLVKNDEEFRNNLKAKLPALSSETT